MEHPAPPLALVTNDDGVDSPGLRELALAALRSGLRVLIAAPLEEASGSSAAVTAVQEEGRVVVERRTIPGLEQVVAFGLPAAPALITLLACRGAFGEAPELVLSGVNRGANWGTLVAHSGTVGAALTGAGRGRRALAVSLCSREALHWETAGAVAEQLIDVLAGLPPASVLSVNVPDLPRDQVRGVVPARIAAVGEVQAAIAEVPDGYVKLGRLIDVGEPGPDTDVALVEAGFAAVTALRPVGEDATLAAELRAAFPPAPPAAAAGAPPDRLPRQGAPRGR